jgi:uncharacterized membrane protein
MTGAFLEFLFRWGHIISGVTWIGLLYYLNLINGAFVAEAAGPTKSEVTRMLLPRILWWFRWSAMSTFVFGLLLIADKTHAAGSTAGYFSSPQGLSIAFGGICGTIMWFNVWFIIWPNQKVIIATTQAAAAAGKAPEGLGKRPRIAFLASRTNLLLSIPMFFFMAASHYPGGIFLKF